MMLQIGDDGVVSSVDEENLIYVDKNELEQFIDSYQELEKENEQLKQDNNGLMRLLENQSIIIQELSSQLLEHQVKEPIVLTKEDLEVMGKAISYYTRGRCGE